VGAGATRTGDLEEHKLRPWAGVFRVPSSAGPVWLKATGPAERFEVGVSARTPRSCSSWGVGDMRLAAMSSRFDEAVEAVRAYLERRGGPGDRELLEDVIPQARHLDPQRARRRAGGAPGRVDPRSPGPPGPNPRGTSANDGSLRIEVQDNGTGGADPNGHGLVGMKDRVTALGGRLEVESPAEGGTLLRATLPCRPS
jgi:hypothetical protein